MIRPIGERPTTVRARAPALSPSARRAPQHAAHGQHARVRARGKWLVDRFAPSQTSPTSIVCVAVHSLNRMPSICGSAPSNVLPTLPEPLPLTTEASSTWGKGGTAPGLTSSRSYRGSIVPKDAGVVYEPPLLTKLEELKARLLRMKAAEPAEPEPEFEESGLLIGSMWMTAEYDSCAKYAGEASKVAASGRLPFGSDSKKMGPF